jgi:dipeptidyl aminopeptidase/acylaminoacyl peptidase
VTRRWLLAAASVAVIAVIVVGAVVRQLQTGAPAEVSPPSTTSPSPSVAATAALTVNVAAFRGQGRLAFATSRSSLELLDGVRSELRSIGRPGLAAWSPNGNWLAYQQQRDPTAASPSLEELRLSRADGTGEQMVSGLPGLVNLVFAWSPVDDLLAVVPQGGSDAKGLWLVRPGASATLLAAGDAPVWSFAWSPNGQELAYSVTLPSADPLNRADALFTVKVVVGEPLFRFRVNNAGILGIAWSPDGRRFLYYEDPQHSGSALMDGVPLKFVIPGPVTKGGTFPDKKIDTFDEWVDADRFVAVLGKDRFPTSNRTLAICEATGLTPACTPLASQPGSVSLEPALAPDHTRIAFVRAAESPGGGFSSEAAATAWMQSRTLWIVDLRTGAAHEEVAVGRGIFAPAWSGDGQHLLLTRDQAGWLYDVGSQTMTKLIAPLDPATPFGGPGWSFAWQR